MYSLNLLDRNVLITADEVIKKVNVTAIDPHLFLSAIEIAEERFVRPLLGSDLYEDMIDQKNVVVDAGNKAGLQAHIVLRDKNSIYQLQDGDIVNAWELLDDPIEYQALWKERLWKFVAECVYFIALPENYAQFTTQGMVKNNPVGSVIGEKSSGSVGIDLKDIKYLNDKQLLERINPLQHSLEEYLCKNISKFPKYPSSKCQSCDTEGKKEVRTTSWVTGMYDSRDEELRRKREGGWGWE